MPWALLYASGGTCANQVCGLGTANRGGSHVCASNWPARTSARTCALRRASRVKLARIKLNLNVKGKSSSQSNWPPHLIMQVPSQGERLTVLGMLAVLFLLKLILELKNAKEIFSAKHVIKLEHWVLIKSSCGRRTLCSTLCATPSFWCQRCRKQFRVRYILPFQLCVKCSQNYAFKILLHKQSFAVFDSLKDFFLWLSLPNT